VKEVPGWVGRRPEDPWPIIYHGTTMGVNADNRTFFEVGIRYFCLSYYTYYDYYQQHPTGSPDYNPWRAHLEALRKINARVMLDSGAFSFLVMGYNKKIPEKELERLIDSYLYGPQLPRQKKSDGTHPFSFVDWLHRWPYPFDFYVTFDYRVHAPTVYRVTKMLKKAGLHPVPVYHGDSSIDWLKRYIDEGHRLIGVSKRFFLNGPRDRLWHYYDQVFRVTEAAGVYCHGFACTGPEMWDYPWHSVDSTTFQKSVGLGTIWYYVPSEGKNGLRKVEVARRRRGRLPGELIDQLRERGLTLGDVQHKRTARLGFSLKALMAFQEDLNKKKGRKVAWKQRKTLF